MIFDFEDDSGEKIKGVAFNDAIKTLDKEIFVGKNYSIAKATVQKTFGRPGASYHHFQLPFFKYSQVHCVMVGSVFEFFY